MAPLKALINDQYDRLSGLCERLEIPVHRWHGDVLASKKSAFLKRPDGILLITPESLEALFVVRGPAVGGLLAALQYVSWTSCMRSSAPSAAHSCAASCTVWSLPSAAGFRESACQPPSAI